MTCGTTGYLRRSLTRWSLQLLLLCISFLLLLSHDDVFVQILGCLLPVTLARVSRIGTAIESLRICLRTGMIGRGIIVVFRWLCQSLSLEHLLVLERIRWIRHMLRGSASSSWSIVLVIARLWCRSSHLTVLPLISQLRQRLRCHGWLSDMLFMEWLNHLVWLTEIQSTRDESEALQKLLRVHCLSRVLLGLKYYLINLSEVWFIPTLLFLEFFFFFFTVFEIQYLQF